MPRSTTFVLLGRVPQSEQLKKARLLAASAALLLVAGAILVWRSDAARDRAPQPYDDHKALLPLDAADWAGLLVALVGIFLAAGGGIGGGGILVPCFLLIMGFPPGASAALSNCTIFGGAVTNMVMNVGRRHPAADRPLIAWDIVMAMEPSTMLGALAGALLSVVLPPIVTKALMVVVLGLTTQRTILKGITVYRTEEELAARDAALPFAVHVQPGPTKVRQSHRRDQMQLLDPPPGEALSSAEERAALPAFPLVLMTSLCVATIVITGVKALVPCASAAYWLLELLPVAPIAGVLAVGRRHLLRTAARRDQAGYVLLDGDVAWDERTTLVYPALCTFAGVCAGLFGIGGGIIKGPLMLHLGVRSDVAAATSATMILFTSFTTVVAFGVHGVVYPDYFGVLMPLGLMASLMGIVATDLVVHGMRRTWPIIALMAVVVGLSTIAMGVSAVLRLVQAPEEALRSSPEAICQRAPA